jgi:hypothetical protein
MKKINFILLAALLGMLTSCGVGVYYPYAHNVFGAQTTVHLDKANFRVVRDVEAVVAVKNTNLSRSSVEKSAYGQLLRNARLTGSQVLINVVIEEIRRDNGLNSFQYVAARATIIEFLDEHGNPTVSESYRPTNTHTTTVTAKPTNNSNASVAAQEVETINTQSTQQMASAEDIQKKCEQVHIQIKKLANGYPGSRSYKKYSNIYTTLPRTQKNMLILQKIQSVVTLYLRSQGTAFPQIEKQLKNAASVEAEIQIFLSYYEE